MKYKCLVLDHDDTAVKSTPQIHYPSFVEILKVLRPEVTYTLEEFTKACFDPGFSRLCKDILNFSDEEMDIEAKIWRSYTSKHTPEFYDNFIEMVKKFKSKGGYIAIVSHSDADVIKRHYQEKGFDPDLIFGWDYPEHQRKPYPYPLHEIMRIFNLSHNELIVLDDLKLGFDMAKACDVFFAAAGWSHTVDDIEKFMRQNSDIYFETVKDFSDFIFAE